MPQMIAGRPSTSVMLVTLLTSELVITSAPLPPCLAENEGEDEIAHARAIRHHQRAQHRALEPAALIASSRQIISNDATRNSARNSHGANRPLASIQ